jgi:hypothetical protein
MKSRVAAEDAQCSRPGALPGLFLIGDDGRTRQLAEGITCIRTVRTASAAVEPDVDWDGLAWTLGNPGLTGGLDYYYGL